MQNEYIMTSIELDEKFVDDASDNYMTDEERNYWIDKEEGATDEEIEETSYQMTDEEQEGLEEYLDDEPYEPTDDVLVDNLFNGCFGVSTKESKSQRRATKKAQVDKVPNIPTSKYFVNLQQEYSNRLAGKFNSEGVK